MTDTSPAVTDRDVYITRAFAAPRDVVWRFFTEPELISRWFGPRDFRVPAETVKVEPEVGGAYALTMVGIEDGELAPMAGIITAFDPPEYLEVRLGAHSRDVDLDNVVLRIRFADHGDRTRVTLHQGPFDAVDRDLTAEGWEQSFEGIDAILEGAGR
ncbi:SRPBCC family protein [Naasia aerilata]|uniref:Activator of Hsp90 ATPase homologue 1/2-like C-terminal domain-containing protein n=1 Tax=Naasia aerilata TaxID=1162966 RepID=A0ABN6XPB3_9MICO|nr:SRPBCC domain-containing protein [Naasia aerilata]BDZ46811.1 hypothetical protein GCM10025866_27200 [Naasia aerilata]